MMIQYKGSYCPAQQNMPKKPQKWIIKVWCLADAKSKFVYNFKIYCGRNGVNEGERDIGGQLPRRREPKQAHEVVMKLIEGNEGKGQCIMIDNFFSSIGLLEELGKIGTYAMGTIRANRVGLPLEF